jgi:hypothetical protein
VGLRVVALPVETSCVWLTHKHWREGLEPFGGGHQPPDAVAVDGLKEGAELRPREEDSCVFERAPELAFVQRPSLTGVAMQQ